MTRRQTSNSDSPFPLSLPQTPGEYLDILRFRWYWIVLGLAIGAVGSQVAVRFVPERFESQTVVLVESSAIPDRFVPRINTQDARDRLRTIHEEILARPRIERVLDDLNPYPELTNAPRDQIVEMIRGRTGIALRGRDAFVVRYTDTDPERAQRMAARLASLFIEQTSGDRAAQALDANQFIEAQLESTRRDLERVESRLGAVKIRNMGMLPRQLEANLATLQRFELQRQSIENQMRAARDRRALLERQLSLQMQMSEPEAQLLPTARSGSDASREPAGLVQLREYLAHLRTRYTDEHPEVQATLARIERFEQQGPGAPVTVDPVPPPEPVASENLPVGEAEDPDPAAEEDPAASTALPTDIMVADLRAQLAATDQDIRAMQASYNEVQQKIGEYQARVEKIPQVEQELQALERDYNLISRYYSELLSRKLQAETASAVERKWQEQFSIIDPAIVPESPVYPNPSLFLLAGTALGLGAGVFGAFLLEVLDPSVKNLRELETLLPYTVLLTLPHVKKSRKRRGGSVDPTPPSPSDRETDPERLSIVS